MRLVKKVVNVFYKKNEEAVIWQTNNAKTAYDKYKKDFGSLFVNEVSLNELFEQTDILSIHLPLSEETKHYVNTAFLNNFKKKIAISLYFSLF